MFDLKLSITALPLRSRSTVSDKALTARWIRSSSAGPIQPWTTSSQRPQATSSCGYYSVLLKRPIAVAIRLSGNQSMVPYGASVVILAPAGRRGSAIGGVDRWSDANWLHGMLHEIVEGLCDNGRRRGSTVTTLADDTEHDVLRIWHWTEGDKPRIGLLPGRVRCRTRLTRNREGAE